MINLLSICDNAEILSVIKLVKIVVKIITISIPILLILTISLDFMRTVASNDADELKKTTNLAVKKIIAGLLIFFVPTFLNLIIGLISNDNTYQVCMDNATTENISAAYSARATRLVAIAKDSITNATYAEAKRNLNKVSDPELRAQYEKELEDVGDALEAKRLIAIVNKSLDTADYEKASAAVESIKDAKLKAQMNEQLQKVSYKMTKYFAQYSSDGYVANALGLPYYNQCDSRWGNIQYDMAGGGSNGGPATLCSSACGYTSFSMIAAGLNHDLSINPYSIVSYMRAPLPTYRGYGAASTGELTSSTFMKNYGLKAESISPSKIEEALSSGKAVLILVPGHYMTLAPAIDGGIILLDPFSNWADSRKGNGETTLDNISSVYGAITWAAAYSKA